MGDTNLDTVAATTFTGAVTGNVTGTLTGDMLAGGTVTYTKVSRIATATGATTGTIADAGLFQFVTVTVATDADDIIILPTPTPGTVIILAIAATGFELRSSAPGSVAINGGTGASAESAIPANTVVFVVCTSATSWQGYDLTGTTLAAIAAAA